MAISKREIIKSRNTGNLSWNVFGSLGAVLEYRLPGGSLRNRKESKELYIFQKPNNRNR